MTMSPGLLIHEDRIFILHGWQSKERFVVLTPEPITVAKVQNAWSYAVRYTAKALDLPDHNAAMKLMLERHPSWQVVESLCPNVQIDLSKADDDTPDA